ncbi:permease for cytosine/purines, uracil, thiamine, allantoin-domain-containing protein [Aspergillus cavernicola]|uniref:Permease for cytosine/purines, uracil, thiamine, allantoin-domain-containing protein n=1 Tax=Aspergillus cavernicola TaxID=176166 RepID=A0ABR4IBZ5_9EURO
MHAETSPPEDLATAESQSHGKFPRVPDKWLSKITNWGIELRGVTPVPLEERTDKQFINVFFVWFTLSTNLLPIITGMVGTFVMGMSLRDASLVILFFNMLCTIPPAYFSTFGSRTGLRQMLHARFTFGYYLVSIIVALNLCTIAGFGVISSVLGGSTLAAVSGGSIDDTAGIVVIGVCGMVVSFGGYKFLHQYERYCWLFALIAIVIATGVGGSRLSTQTPTQPPTAATVLSFGGVIAGFLIPWAGMAADFSVYCAPTVSTTRIFTYTYLGLFLPTVPLMTLGAAIGSATPSIPEWSSGYSTYGVGGVLESMLQPAGGFGKFVSVLLSFSLLGNLTASMYSISLNFQLLLPFFVRIPRFIFSILYTAILIPVSIAAAKSFFTNLENFLYVIAYWSAAFVSVVLVEHFFFRQSDCTRYEHGAWDQPKQLPTGIAALGAMALSFGLVVPCMGQAWFTGPIAETTGDIGFEVALVLAGGLYVPLRVLERRIRSV